MTKLLKVEFRKARTALIALIGIAVGLEIYYLASIHFDSVDNIAISTTLLFFSALAMALFVFIRGITSYSKELSDKTGYMLFMTPSAPIKIVGSKFLYTFFNGLLCAVLMGALAVYDVRLGLKHYGEYEAFLSRMLSMLDLYGIHVNQMLYVILFYVLFEFLAVMQVFATAYFAITLSHTLFHDRKGRLVISALLFFALSLLIRLITSRFPSIREVVDPIQMRGGAPSDGVEVSFWGTIMPTLIPPAILSAVVIVASMLGCAWLLKHKISL